ncbi:chromate transporter [Allofustis seminis]|uniref:chromate transporter n=1 Tax=Allofustis seminis TaxID=166939 RepID=UPI00035FA3D0|nr:chromate transporter [Allofustis seminis]
MAKQLELSNSSGSTSSDITNKKEDSHKKRYSHILWQLFFSTLFLSAFTFGGGYVIVSLMKKKFVDELGWIDAEEMLDLIAIAQSAPGAIAVNGALVVGYKLAGFLGIVVAVVGTLIPPFVIIGVLSLFYTAFRSNFWIALLLEGMQAGVGAVIAAVVFQMGGNVLESRDGLLILLMGVAFILNAIFQVNVLFIIGGAIILGIIRYWHQKGRDGA